MVQMVTLHMTSHLSALAKSNYALVLGTSPITGERAAATYAIIAIINEV